jgi:MFS transporter, FSR family, fosmidomycin resistance protein
MTGDEQSALAGARDSSRSDPPESARFNRGTVSLLSGAHFAHDAYPSFVGVVLPLLISKLGLSLAEAGLLASGIRWTTMVQPVFGYIADRTDTRYWVIVTPATTAVFISLIGIAPSFLAVFVLLLLSGLSHAAFHPASAAVVTRISGRHWGKGTSYFMTGGELGRALGPLYIAAVLSAVGLEASWIALFPGVAFSFLLYHRVIRAGTIRFRHPPGRMRDAFGQARGSVILLSLAIVLRSAPNMTFVTFFPTLLVAHGSGLVYAGTAIAAYEIGGTVGAFLGGTASDRFGRRPALAVSLLAGLPALALAVTLPAGAPQLMLLGLAGFAILSGMPVQLVFMHELFPDNRSAATGITYFMLTAGGILAMLATGALGDLIGLQSAMLLSVAVGAAALPLVLRLPSGTRS